MELNKIKINNFKSIKELSIDLRNINILIGPNGVGKFNFIQFFNLLNNIVSQNLQSYITQNGGADNFLHFGRKVSDSFSAYLSFGRNDYLIELTPTDDNNFYFIKEIIYYEFSNSNKLYSREIAKGNREAHLSAFTKKNEVSRYFLNALVNWRVYHFHDTSSSAKLKQDGDINDNRSLRRDASNLAAFLLLTSGEI